MLFNPRMPFRDDHDNDAGNGGGDMPPLKKKARLDESEEQSNYDDTNDGDEKETKTSNVSDRKMMLSKMPFIIPKTKSTTTLLMEATTEGSIDMDFSRDIGAVGRFSIQEDVSEALSSPLLLVDLKGYVFKGHLSPCTSFLVVTIGNTEARVEAVANSFLNLKCVGNGLDNETVYIGTLDEENSASGERILLDDDIATVPGTIEAGFKSSADMIKTKKVQKKKGKKPVNRKPKSKNISKVKVNQ